MRIKRWHLLIIIIVVLVLATPFVTGLLFKHNYMNLIAAINANSQVKATVTDYQLGWFSSDATLSLSFDNSVPTYPTNPPKEFALSFVMTVTQHITHGPILYAPTEHTWRLAQANVLGVLHMPAQIEAAVLGSRAQEGSLQLDLLSTFFHGYILKLREPSINLQAGMENLTWQGLSGQMNFTLAEQHIHHMKSLVTIGALNASTKAASMFSQPITTTTDITYNADHLWEGSHTLLIPEIILDVTQSESNYMLKNFRAAYFASMSAPHLYNIRAQFTLDNFLSPAFEIGSSNLVLALSKLNADAWNRFIQAVETSPLPNPSHSPSQAMLDNLYILITPDTLISEDVSLNSKNGILTSHGEASWPQPINSLQDMMSKIKLKLSIRVSQSLIQKLITMNVPLTQPTTQSNEVTPTVPANPYAYAYASATDTPPANNTSETTYNNPSTSTLTQARVDQWVQLGYLTVDKNDFITDITYENGVVKANGHEVNEAKH